MNEAATFADFANEVRAQRPEIALVLGSGLGGLAGGSRNILRMPFDMVPGLNAPSVVGHDGSLTLAKWAGRPLLLFEGRLHFYEGHPWHSVLESIRIAHLLGTRVLLLTNAAGGIRDDLVPGSLMAVRDHIEWTRPYCWRWANPENGEQKRCSAYSARLLQLMTQTGDKLGFPIPIGTYAAVTGPCYETPAEIRALKVWGADAVGMSTAREAQRGFDLGLEIAALSLITNRAAGLSAGPIHHEEVLKTAAGKMDHVGQLLDEFVGRA